MESEGRFQRKASRTKEREREIESTSGNVCISVTVIDLIVFDTYTLDCSAHWVECSRENCSLGVLIKG